MAYQYKWFGGDLHGVVDGNQVMAFYTEEEGAKQHVSELNTAEKAVTALGKLARVADAEGVEPKQVDPKQKK